MSPFSPGLRSLREFLGSAQQPGQLLGTWLQRLGPDNTWECCGVEQVEKWVRDNRWGDRRRKGKGRRDEKKEQGRLVVVWGTEEKERDRCGTLNLSLH